MLTAATLTYTGPVRARLAWLDIRPGDVLLKVGAEYRTADGRVVPAWIVALNLGGAFEAVKRGQQEMRLPCCK